MNKDNPSFSGENFQAYMESMRRKLFESFQSALAERGLDPNQILGL